MPHTKGFGGRTQWVYTCLSATIGLLPLTCLANHLSCPMSDEILSIVIPTHARPHGLLRLVKSICDTSYAMHRCKVSIVVDRSRYGQDLLRSIGDLPWFSVVQSPHAGPAAARNCGASLARSPFVAFVDDDCVLPSSYIDDLLPLLAALPNRVGALGGSVRPLPTSSTSSVARYLAAIDHLNGPLTSGGKIVNMASANLCVRLQAFVAVGGFDPRFCWAGGEDQDLITRISSLGDIMFQDKFYVFHDHEVPLLGFVRKFFRYGRGVALADHLSGAAYPLDSLYTPIPLSLTHPIASGRALLSAVRSTAGHASSMPGRIVPTLLAALQELAFQAGYFVQQRQLATASRSAKAAQHED